MRNYYKEIQTYSEKLIKEILKSNKKGFKFKDINLSFDDISVIKQIKKAENIKMFEIINELKIDRNTFVTIEKKLINKKIIKKEKDNKDKRTFILKLTKKGEDALEQINKNQTELLYSILDDFSFNEEKAILKFLVKLDMVNKIK